MAEAPFTYSINALTDASGNAVAELGPESAREVWHDITVSVKTTQTTVTNEAQCLIYSGDVNTMRFRDGCVDGSTGDSSDRVTGSIKVGEVVRAVWSGADPGVYAVLTVDGVKTI